MYVSSFTQHIRGINIQNEYVIFIRGGMCLWLMIRNAALPVASCQGSALISARMKVTEDDRRPNAFSPAADFLTQTPRFRQMGTGRSNYVAADLQFVHATALRDGAVTRFMLDPFYLIAVTLFPRL